MVTAAAVLSLWAGISVSTHGFRSDTNPLDNLQASPSDTMPAAAPETFRQAQALETESRSEEAEYQTLPMEKERQSAKRLQVGAGDTISTLLGGLGISARDIHQLLQAGSEASQLYRIFPGQVFEVSLDSQGALQRLIFEESAARSVEWVRAAGSSGNEFVASVKEIEPERELSYASETIVKNLFVAGQRSGLGDEIILRLARIFRWDIDFVLDIRAGDAFEVLYESEYLNGELYRYGEILAARFVNRGKTHTAIRYVDEDGDSAYFAPDGTNLRGAFLRAPVDFTRVSSGFSLKRRHPIFDRVRAHLGIDYAAPTGTPVMAAGDGTVITVAYRSSSGNYVEIRHANSIETRYLHLSGFAKGLKQGDRVAQGEVIGYVGSTGWSTGPHLHYEFIENGRHLDPQKVAVVRDSAISDDERIRFLIHMDPLLQQLNHFGESHTNVAAAQ